MEQMFFTRKKLRQETYDPGLKKPMIRVSICTGEKVAGFVYHADGHFEEVALLRSEQDLQEFKDRYGITGEIGKFY